MKDRVFQLCDAVRETGYAVHRYLGPGHLEKVYENALANRLRKQGFAVKQQYPLAVFDEDGTLLGDYFADLLIEDSLVVEIKAARTTADEHVAQLLGYLRASRVEHGLLANFGGPKFFIKKFAMSASTIRPAVMAAVRRTSLILLFAFLCALCVYSASGMQPVELRVEWLVNPVGIDAAQPRLSWRVESDQRAQRQSAYRVLAASAAEQLARGSGDLWDSGKIASDETLNIPYSGSPLRPGQRVFWKVQVWDKDGRETISRDTATFSMGLMNPEDWKAQWISFRDSSALHTNRKSLFLPPARHYRKPFSAKKPVKRATVYASALGIFELHLNGTRVGDAFFEPGWADYNKRNYYRAHDVTALVQNGDNCIGGIVAEGWYSGYVGYGLLVGYGPNKAGRYFYGKTPAFLAQLEIEYADGSRDIVGTDTSWQVSADGPIREADMIMGEAFDARRDDPNWCNAGERVRHLATPLLEWNWESAIRAEANGSTKAVFSDNTGSREVELGFQRPPKLQAYTAPPIRITEELATLRLTEPKPGVYIFDLGQNFAGIIRLKVKGPAGTKLQIRYGEMLHPDGRLMTENLRRARATDFYTMGGDPDGETWQPRFTYHGFQFVEITGFPGKPDRMAVTGLVLHNDTPLIGRFECSDEVMTQFGKNAQWTQRANFLEVPTDCPQRDERLGWMGDAQAYVRTATYNADVAAFFTKWLDDVEEAQRASGAYPDYAPYPMGHGAPGQTWGTAWTDAGVICPWTIWQVYGDTHVLERHWSSMTRFMEWRLKRAPDFLGRKDGNTWGDWLNVNESTPLEFIDMCFHALDGRMMAEMAGALGRTAEGALYRDRFERIQEAFAKTYLTNGALTIDTQTAHVLPLSIGLLRDDVASKAAARLAAKIEKNGYRMATGFLGTRPLLPVLTAHGQNDLAVRLFQSRRFPSWGYEVVNGATTVWERWDSFTKEHGFNGAGGDQNASMNSFSHYAFGAVMEWAYRDLAGIDTDGAGYKRIVIRPNPPSAGSNPDVAPVDWVKAEYGSARGRIVSDWRRGGEGFELNVTIPANTTATVFMPADSLRSVKESGQPITDVSGVKFVRAENKRVVLAVQSGTYRFVSKE